MTKGQPKLLAWTPNQVLIYDKFKAGMSHTEIWKETKISKPTITKVSNAMKKGQSPAMKYVPKGQPQHPPNFPPAKEPSENGLPTGETAGTPGAGENKEPATTPKPSLGNASLLLLKPMPQSCALTPIMINARFTAITELKWPEGITWEDFFDTCLVWLFKYWGYGLQGVYKLEAGGNGGSPKPASEKASGNGDSPDKDAAAIGYAVYNMLKKEGAVKAS